MKLTSVEINPVAIETGEWIGDLPDCDDLRIRTRGLNCAAYEAMMQKKIRSLPRNIRNSPSGIPAAIMRSLTLACVVETCLQDWEALAEDDGTLIPFSKAKALEIIANPKLRPLHDAMVTAASRVGEQRAADVDEAVGNSPSA